MEPLLIHPHLNRFVWRVDFLNGLLPYEPALILFLFLIGPIVSLLAINWTPLIDLQTPTYYVILVLFLEYITNSATFLPLGKTRGIVINEISNPTVHCRGVASFLQRLLLIFENSDVSVVINLLPALLVHRWDISIFDFRQLALQLRGNILEEAISRASYSV